MPRWALSVLAGGLAVGLLACTSPEARRARGQGPGADPGNRRGTVFIHEGADPYHDTPRLLGRLESEKRPRRTQGGG